MTYHFVLVMDVLKKQKTISMNRCFTVHLSSTISGFMYVFRGVCSVVLITENPI